MVWDHITGLLADPALIRAEIDRGWTQARTSDPVTRQRKQLELALAKTGHLGHCDDRGLLRAADHHRRAAHADAAPARPRSQPAHQLDALDAQAADRDAYLKLAGDLDSFLAQLRGSAATTSVQERQRVLRLLVKDVLIGPEKITIRHRIPVREPASGGGHHDTTDTEGDMRQSYPLCWGRALAAARQYCPLRAG